MIEQIIKAYSIKPVVCEHVIAEHEKHRHYLTTERHISNFKEFLDKKTPQILQALPAYQEEGESQPYVFGDSFNDNPTKNRIFFNNNVPPTRMREDMKAVDKGQDPEGSYGCGGIIEILPQIKDSKSIFGFTPLEGHGIIAVIGEISHAGNRPVGIAIASEAHGIITFGKIESYAVFLPKNNLVQSIANAIQLHTKIEGCGGCKTPCANENVPGASCATSLVQLTL